VTVAVAAIAETGSVVLVEPDGAALLLDLWAHHLVVAVDRAHLLAALPDAAPVLTRATTAGVVTVLSGPSRTADIERRLSIGVQGPREVTVVVIG
jgi:L-lactate dehydrogenase complex protein LldG